MSIQVLLECLYKYYCVGASQSTLEFAGTAHMKAVVTSKIDGLFNHEETFWTAFVHSLRQHYLIDKILDRSFLQFPNLVVEIILEEYSMEWGKCTKSVVVTLELKI